MALDRPTYRLLLAGGALVFLCAAALLTLSSKSTAPAADDTSGRDILLNLGATAVQEQRLLAPAGSNAYEFYLSVLQLEPDNQTALTTLHRLLPAAADVVERSIDRGDLDEAQRELALLRDVDADDYLPALLGGKLDAQRQLVIRRHEASAALIQARMAGEPHSLAR
jgi:protein TonB